MIDVETYGVRPGISYYAQATIPLIKGTGSYTTKHRKGTLITDNN